MDSRSTNSAGRRPSKNSLGEPLSTSLAGSSPESLTYRLFKVTSIAPAEVGVTGCGKQGEYVRIVAPGAVGPWALTAAAESADESASGTNDPGVDADQHARVISDN